MSKLRVHEIARELDKSNKEVMDFLKSKNIDVKSHMSSLEDDHVSLIRSNLRKGNMAAASTDTAKPAASAEEKPKKKLIQVFRPQNASHMPERKQKPQNHPAEAGSAHSSSQPGNNRPAQGGMKTESTANTQNRTDNRPGSNNGERPNRYNSDNRNTDRPNRYNNDNRSGDNRPRYNNSGDGQNRYNNDNRNGDNRPRTNSGDGQNRYNNDNRPRTNTGDRPRYNSDNRNGDNRPRTNTGDRPRYNSDNRNGDNRPRTNTGDRPRYNSDNRNGDNRPRTNTGDRPRYNSDNRNGDNRPRTNTGDRPRYNSDNRNGDNRPRTNTGDRPRYNNDNRGGDNRPRTGSGPNRFGDNRQRGTDNRPGGGFNRDKGGKADAPKLEFVEKDSRKLNRENKKKDVKKDDLKTGSKRPNQGGGRRPNQRLPRALQRPNTQPKVEEKKEVVKEITLPEKMTIRELADKMKMQPSVIVKKLFMDGIMVTVNHEIDFEKAQEIALDYDIIAEPEVKVDVIAELLKEDDEDESLLVSRPPVVCVMGHVDHGKTSLLDCIRNTHVTDREAGGITQHIGAYMVTVNDQKITFLDTPGHEAFTAMRMRGANATDIAILVVAADDGVMPQTVEAINHAKAAGVEIIVAINKIDKPSANIERVKQELSEYELIPEDWGGSTIFVPVSAHSGEGIETLLEMIILTAEVAELKANPKRMARGLVIEAELDKGKGPVATILVQKGTLHVGDFIAAGACSGKVRAMMDDKGRRVKEASPSTPVEILGLGDVPNAGEILVATENDKEAKHFAATFVSENKNRLLEETKAKMSLDDLFTQIQAGNLKELPLIVKADVQGSVEAVKQSLVKISNEEVVVKVIHGGVGAINESDVTLASASNAIIIGFNVRPDVTAKAIAEQEGVDLRLYRVIYQAIEDVEAAMKGMLDPVYEEKVIGHAEVRQTFKSSDVGTIAGGYVLDGMFQRNCKVRITRGEEQIYEGVLASLKRFKDDVKEVKAGYECGLVFEDFSDVKEEDRVEAYIMVEVPR
ncbi:translation initiation factor IF-2 [Blautia pseudococcoides]|uniref:translation initiation factor IF-2 n=1 Tax=Blautia pseudococcoides TaxID=1796616 RepID=UPI00148AFF58|nr:translation initiation factor IF-2 [Blautia pseudococcoides]QJU13457.1 translation initiation factor IF-2 [Blautia pseudococcoides]